MSENEQKPTTPLNTEAIVHARLDQIVASLGSVQAQLSTIVTSQQDVVLRLDRLETWKEGVELRLARNSERAGSVTENDTRQDAAISRIIVDVDGVKKDVANVKADVARLEQKTDVQTQILERLEKITEHPMVRRIAYAVGGILLTYLGAKAQGLLP